MSVSALLSIGVYGFTEESFFQSLQDADTDCFCDVRARRGLRGSEYAFANSVRLQDRLRDLKISYLHLKNLSPSKSVREAQKREDERVGVAKRNRKELGEAFVDKYCEEVLNSLDAASLLEDELKGMRRPVFFCVERHPSACHRSLLTKELSRQTGLPVEHIVP